MTVGTSDSLLNAIQCGHNGSFTGHTVRLLFAAEKSTLGPQVINQQEVFRGLNFIFFENKK
jgi:hypothetical protein